MPVKYKLGTGDTVDITAITKTNQGSGSGLDSDLLDGLHRASYEELARKGVASGYCDLDASILVPLARIPATLTGKDADTVDSFHGADLEKLANKNIASGYPGLSAGSLIAGTQITYGTSVSTACQGNDSRLSDARTPTAHAPTHERGGSDIAKASRLYSGLDASKPGTGNTEGDVWWATDTDKLYVWDGIAWKDIIGTGGGATTFLGLTDTPDSYTAQAKKIVRVNAGAMALEFVSELDALVLNNPKIKDIDATPVDDVLLKVIDGVLKVRNSADSADAAVTAKELLLSTQLGVGVAALGNNYLTEFEGDTTTWAALLRINDTRVAPGGQRALSFASQGTEILYVDNLGNMYANQRLYFNYWNTAKYGRLTKDTDGFLGLEALGTDINIDLEIRPKGTGVVRLGGATGLEVDTSGYLKPINVSLPTASSAYRGKVARVEGATGVEDVFYICEKGSDNNYYWQRLNTGAGHITILPFNYNSITQGNWGTATDTLQPLNTVFYNVTAANLDRVNYLFSTAPGTYTFSMMHIRSTDYGIMDILIDGVSIGTIDGYASSTERGSLTQITGISIVVGGLKTLSIKVNGKNASSSGYYAKISSTALWRTA